MQINIDSITRCMISFFFESFDKLFDKVIHTVSELILIKKFCNQFRSEKIFECHLDVFLDLCNKLSSLANVLSAVYKDSAI